MNDFLAYAALIEGAAYIIKMSSYYKNRNLIPPEIYNVRKTIMVLPFPLDILYGASKNK